MSEIFGIHGIVVALVALVVIGPKDLPKAMRVLGYWVGKARGVAQQFRSGFDEMVREAELEEMEKRWASENARIMREHPQTPPDQPAIEHKGFDASQPPVMTAQMAEENPAPVHVEKPVVEPAPADRTPSPHSDGAAS